MKTLGICNDPLRVIAALTVLSGCSVLPLNSSKAQDDAQSRIGSLGVMPVTGARPFDKASPLRYRVLFSFGISRGGHYGYAPTAPLVYLNGTFYGTTAYGGFSTKDRDPVGVVFAMSPSGKVTVLHRFEVPRSDAPEGNEPYGGLTALRGRLYGTTYEGGTYGYGTIFRMSTTGEFRTLYNFNYRPSSPVSGGPLGQLVVVNDVLYGTTVSGGAGDYGTVYSMTTRGKVQVLHTFDGADGRYPTAGLLNLGGTLYGTTNVGGKYDKGTVFRVSTTGDEKVLFNFNGADGAFPDAPLVAANGKLYGTTVRGGSKNWGTVFSMRMSGRDETVLHSFSYKNGDGARPEAGLIVVNGTLYGTTAFGGVTSPSALCRAYGCGIIYSITTTGKETLVHQFQEDYENDGSVSVANLIDVNGKLYGTTEYGGYTNPNCQYPCYYGTVFEFRP